MDKQRLTVDDLLARQSSLRPGCRATVKSDLDGRVTITPVVAGGVSACAYKVTVDKGDIEDLAVTDEVIDCCGESRMVVEVGFKNATVASIFRQLSEIASKSLMHAAVSALPEGRPSFGPLAPSPARPGSSRRALPPGRPPAHPAWDTVDCYFTYLRCDESCGWWSASDEDLRLCRWRCYENYQQCMGLPV